MFATPLATPSLPGAFSHLADLRGPRLAVFDADGVLWHGDVSEDFTLWMIDSGHFDGSLWPEYVASNAKDPAVGCLEILRFYQGMEMGRLQAHGRDYWHAHPERAWIQPALRAVHWLGQHGFQVYVVSGTPSPVLGPLAERLGLEPDHILALELEVDANGRATGRHSGVPTTCQGKARRLREASKEPVCLAAGNSVLDIQMLQLSEHTKWVINPDAALRAVAEREGWLISDEPED